MKSCGILAFLRLLYHIIHWVSFEIKFYVDCQNVIQYTINYPSRMIEIIGIGTCHEQYMGPFY